MSIIAAAAARCDVCHGNMDHIAVSGASLQMSVILPKCSVLMQQQQTTLHLSFSAPQAERLPTTSEGLLVNYLMKVHIRPCSHICNNAQFAGALYPFLD